MTNTDMTKPSEQPETGGLGSVEIQTITAAELWDLSLEEGDDLNLFKINALDVRSHLHPEVTDPSSWWTTSSS